MRRVAAVKLGPMRVTLRILAVSANLAALLVIGGGHWAALQTVAWAQMIVDYTQDSGSLRQSIVQTFDGEHPCELCRQISAGIQKEQRQDRQQTRQDERLGKVTLLAVRPTMCHAAPAQPECHQSLHAAEPDGRLADAPPVPPPRLG